MRAVRELREERPALEADGDAEIAGLRQEPAQGGVALALVADVHAPKRFASLERFLDGVNPVDDVVEVHAFGTRVTPVRAS